MAYEVHGHGAISRIAGAAIVAGQPVRPDPAVEHQVLPAADATVEPIGVALQDAAIGKDVTVHLPGNIVRARANGAIANGANVSAVAASTRLVTSPALAGTFRVGIAQGPAVAGDVFSVLVHPEKIA